MAEPGDAMQSARGAPVSSDTLEQAALKVLLEGDPWVKAEYGDLAATLWLQGAMQTAYHADGPLLAVPSRPARLAIVRLVAPRDMPKLGRGGSLQSRQALVHSLVHTESWAIDLSWDIIARFGKAEAMPREFFDDFVRVAQDEGRHFRLLAERLAQLNSSYGALPAHDGLWDSAEATAHDLKARLAVEHCVHEARGLDVLPTTVSRFRRGGDEETATLLESVIYPEEITHCAAGVKWFSFLCRRLRNAIHTPGARGCSSEDGSPASEDLAPTSQDRGPASEDGTRASEDLPPTSQDGRRTSEDLAPTSQDTGWASEDLAPTSQDGERTSEDLAVTSQDGERTSEDLAPTSQDRGRVSEDGGRDSKDGGPPQGGERAPEAGRRPSQGGGRGSEDGGHGSEDGGLGSENGRLGSEDGGLGSEDGGLGSENGGLGSEDGGRGSEDGGRGSEDGGRGSEDGGRDSEVVDAFHRVVRAYFRGPLKPPFNDAARAAAGFGPEWYLPLALR